MANETLSPSQANEIIRKSVDVLNNIEKTVHQKSNDFLQGLSKVWEDQHAVDFAKDYQNSFRNALTSLQSNFDKFHENVSDIVKRYAATSGNQASISVMMGRLNKEVEIGAVHDHFLDGENEDEFGFKQNGLEQVEDGFKQLSRSLAAVSEQASSEINHINAFGNIEVQNGLAKSAGKIVEILETHVKEIEKFMDEKLASTMEDYIKTGVEAVDTSKILDAFKEGIIGPPNISTFYGGVQPNFPDYDKIQNGLSDLEDAGRDAWSKGIN